MSASPFEVPGDLREFAERSVEQARKAFEGFLAVAQRSAGVAGDAAGAGQGGVKTFAAQVLGYTEQNASAAFDLASKLVKAKDPQEALALHGDYVKSQIAALQTQAKEIAAAFQKSIAPGSR